MQIAKNAAQTANNDGRESASLIELLNLELRVSELEHRLRATGDQTPSDRESYDVPLWPPLSETGDVAGAIDRAANMIAPRLHLLIAALSVDHCGDLDAINDVRSYFGNETL